MNYFGAKEYFFSQIQEMLMEAGACKVGAGDLSALPEEQRRGLPRGISIAVAMNLDVINHLGAGMTSAYYDEYKRTNALLDELALLAAELLERQGYKAIPVIRKESKVSYREHASLLPHKTVATRAGMGWIGKNALLVTREFGSAVRITSVLTDAPLPCADPVNESSCGECTMCVSNCPGQAPLGPAWSADLSRGDFFDVLSCRKACIERSWCAVRGESLCSLCVLVCPWTQKAIEKEGLAYGFPAVEIAGKGDLEEILALQKLAFLQEAKRCSDYCISPITQTLEDMTAEYSDPRKAQIFLKIVKDRRIVGSVRACEADGTCYIGRLMVHPDYQRGGLGRRLMEAIESCYEDARYELFTGSKSPANIRFYESLGYKTFKTEDYSECLRLIYLEKA